MFALAVATGCSATSTREPKASAAKTNEPEGLTVKVDRKNGRIISGEMDNPLYWHGRACVDEELKQCGDVPPMKYRRTLKLELLGDA